MGFHTHMIKCKEKQGVTIPQREWLAQKIMTTFNAEVGGYNWGGNGSSLFLTDISIHSIIII